MGHRTELVRVIDPARVRYCTRFKPIRETRRDVIMVEMETAGCAGLRKCDAANDALALRHVHRAADVSVWIVGQHVPDHRVAKVLGRVVAEQYHAAGVFPMAAVRFAN